MKYILLILIAISSCTCGGVPVPEPFVDPNSWTYEKKQWVKKNDWSKVENFYYLNYKVFSFITGTGFTGNQKADIYNSIENIEWRPKEWECESHSMDESCDGDLYYDKDDQKYYIIMKIKPCLPLTKLSHFLMHIFHNEVWGNMDWEHTKPELYAVESDNKYHSAEWVSNTQGVAAGLCEGVK